MATEGTVHDDIEFQVTVSVVEENARELLADLAFTNSTPPALRRRLAKGTCSAVIYQVPEATWTDAILEAVAEVADRDKLLRIEPNETKRRAGFDWLAERMGEGRMVVGVSHAPESTLPPLLMSLAEHRIVIDPPSASLVASVIKRILKGRLPRWFHELRTEVLTFDELTALMPQGGKASTAAGRIKSAIEARLSVSKSKGLPSLKDALEFGEAR
ncbi:hypothetical protein, partial [Devosia sp.]|uniref:hypothetical protein n=1 Tax=Devosia sp. TaxID=1871048 RepID=UPI001AD0AC0A